MPSTAGTSTRSSARSRRRSTSTGCCAAIVDLVSEAIDCHACSSTSSSQTARSSCAPSPIRTGRLSGELRFEPGEGLAGWVAEHDEPVFLADNALADPRIKVVPEADEEKYQSFFAVPLRGKADGVLGVIALHAVAPREFSEDDSDFLTHAASLVAGAIENARLYEDTRRRLALVEDWPTSPGPSPPRPRSTSCSRRSPVEHTAARGRSAARFPPRFRRRVAAARRTVAPGSGGGSTSSPRRGSPSSWPATTASPPAPPGVARLARASRHRSARDAARLRRGAPRVPRGAAWALTGRDSREARGRGADRGPDGGRRQEGAADRPPDGAQRDQGLPGGPLPRVRATNSQILDRAAAALGCDLSQPHFVLLAAPRDRAGTAVGRRRPSLESAAARALPGLVFDRRDATRARSVACGRGGSEHGRHRRLAGAPRDAERQHPLAIGVSNRCDEP